MVVFFVERRSLILEEGDVFKLTIKACTARYLCLFMKIPANFMPRKFRRVRF